MTESRLLITLDTNALDQWKIDELRAVIDIPCEISYVNTSGRERGEDMATLERLDEPVLETGVWGEGTWGSALWGGGMPEVFVLDESRVDGPAVVGGPEVGQFYEPALLIIANGSFPDDRENMSPAVHRQKRDAMIFDAHARRPRHVLITNDIKGFVLHGKREKLERLGRTRILTFEEFLDVARDGRAAELIQPPT